MERTVVSFTCFFHRIRYLSRMVNKMSGIIFLIERLQENVIRARRRRRMTQASRKWLYWFGEQREKEKKRNGGQKEGDDGDEDDDENKIGRQCDIRHKCIEHSIRDIWPGSPCIRIVHWISFTNLIRVDWYTCDRIDVPNTQQIRAYIIHVEFIEFIEFNWAILSLQFRFVKVKRRRRKNSSQKYGLLWQKRVRSSTQPQLCVDVNIKRHQNGRKNKIK